jgi:uracil-DNA glycosylase family 4
MSDLGTHLTGLAECRRCSRLVACMADLAPKRGWTRADYWNRPVPGFGDPRARVCLVGLAPGAHGANRTGRPFTGDGAGDFMYPLLHQAGYASRPTVRAVDDGLQLQDLYITNAVKCLPPENLPRPEEYAACRPFLARELAALPQLKVVLALGQGAYVSCLRLFKEQGRLQRLADHPFGHGAVCELPGALLLVGCYHTSRYNVQTGRMTPELFQNLLTLVRRLSGGENG